jgi:hypothetical protein
MDYNNVYYMPYSKHDLEKIQYALSQVFGTSDSTWRANEAEINEQHRRGRW